MSISIVNIMLAVVILVIVPMLCGNAVCELLCIEHTISSDYVTGIMTVWALFQLIAEPIILAKGSFLLVVILVSVFLFSGCVFSVYKKKYACIHKRNWTIWQFLAFILMACEACFVIIQNIRLQHLDADDSRFVVNAVDILRTNRLFLTNPATGESMTTWAGELIKDVTSPWAVYIAYCAKITGIHPTVMAHTLLPPVLLLAVCMIFWMLSEYLIGENVGYRSLFVFIALLLCIYGYYSIYSTETFTMTRLWQGKAVVAAVGIPMIWLQALRIYQDEYNKASYVALFIVTVSMCFMSGMGIIISVIMTGCIGLIYGFAKKNYKVMFGIWMSALPGITFYGINLLL